MVTFDFLFVNGRDGTEIDSSYDGEPAEIVFEEALLPGVCDGLDGLKAGSEVLVAIAPADGGGPDPEAGVEETDTILFYAEILEVQGGPGPRGGRGGRRPWTACPPWSWPRTAPPRSPCPRASRPPSSSSSRSSRAPAPPVESGQTDHGPLHRRALEGRHRLRLLVGERRALHVRDRHRQVIAGWDEGLVGQTVGSQVLLVVPPAKGYPEGSRTADLRHRHAGVRDRHPRRPVILGRAADLGDA